MATTITKNGSERRGAVGERPMKLVRRGALTALAIILTGAGHAGLVGCGGSDSEPEAALESEPKLGPGPDGGGGEEPGSDDPDTSPPPVSPPVEGEPVVAVYVSSTKGSDGADGTKTRPLKTLAAAIPVAKTKGLPVWACAEEYTEAVTLEDGVAMQGDHDCTDLDDWKRGDLRAKIVSPSSPAVLAEGLTAPTRLEGFEIIAPDAPEMGLEGVPAASSYGMIVRSSKDLTLVGLVIRAGKGQDGADGAEPASGNAELSTSVAGGSASPQRKCQPSGIIQCNLNFIPGAAGGTSQCKVGPNGGRGGEGGKGIVSRDGKYAMSVDNEWARGLPLVAGLETAAGGTPSSPRGKHGAAGAVGPAGSNGAWSFAESGFVPGGGTAGSDGLSGQGGGGGYGSWLIYERVQTPYFPNPPDTGTYYGTAGTGGGAGGCGGIAGTAGGGGGASVGLFVVASENIVITTSRIEGKEGGGGGHGALGTLGTPGGAAGSDTCQVSNPITTICAHQGGAGGAGGAAGLSGHGAPGPSFALVYDGARPATVDVELVAGTPGAGAPAISRGDQIVPAISGVAAEEHSF